MYGHLSMRTGGGNQQKNNNNRRWILGVWYSGGHGYHKTPCKVERGAGSVPDTVRGSVLACMGGNGESPFFPSFSP